MKGGILGRLRSEGTCSRTAALLSASLQFVRKLSGFTKPSKANEAAFDRAVEEVSTAATRLLDSLVTQAKPRNREEVVAKAQARAAKRYGPAPAPAPAPAPRA